MNIGIIGHGRVAQSLVPLLLNQGHKLFSWRRYAELPRDQYFKKIWDDETPHPMTQRNMISVIIDLLGNSDDSAEISKESIEKSLKNDKIVITSNQALISKHEDFLIDKTREYDEKLFVIQEKVGHEKLVESIIDIVSKLQK